MNNRKPTLARQYVATLRKFTTHEQEAALEQAHALGRAAIARGLGVLDMARLHQEALTQLLETPAIKQPERALRTAETFFLEALSPFEATHRGFRETNLNLHQLIATLEKRNSQLGDMNVRLQSEVRERRRSEIALRQSERHFRQLFTRAREMEQRLRELSNQVLHVQEEERKRISRELHDETGQALAAISITLAGVNGESGLVNKQKVASAQKLLRGTMQALDDFARELRPTSLDELGVVPALRSYLRHYANRTGLQVSFKADSEVESLDSSAKTVLFRVAQENLTNVAMRASATEIDFRIEKLKHGFGVTIVDNGKLPKGRAHAAAERLRRLAIQERVRLVNGEYSFRATPRRGTTLRVVIPFTLPAGKKTFSQSPQVKNPKMV